MEDICPACSQDLAGPVMVRLGHSRLVQCITCESWTYLPRVSSPEQDALHDNADYAEHPYFQGRRSTAATDRRCREVFARIGHVLDLKNLASERILDIGCDVGTFIISATNQFGVIPVGLDVSARSVAQAKLNGVEAYHARLEQAPDHLMNFPLITAVDVVEHVVDLEPFLKEVYRRLRPGGCFYLETPNIRSLVYRLGALLCRWTGGRPRSPFERLFPPQHVQYFTPTSLTELVRRHGFEPAYIGLRVLPFRDLSTSLLIRLGLMGVQGLDILHGQPILIDAVLRKGGGA